MMSKTAAASTDEQSAWQNPGVRSATVRDCVVARLGHRPLLALAFSFARA